MIRKIQGAVGADTASQKNSKKKEANAKRMEREGFAKIKGHSLGPGKKKTTNGYQMGGKNILGGPKGWKRPNDYSDYKVTGTAGGPNVNYTGGPYQAPPTPPQQPPAGNPPTPPKKSIPPFDFSGNPYQDAKKGYMDAEYNENDAKREVMWRTDRKLYDKTYNDTNKLTPQQSRYNDALKKQLSRGEIDRKTYEDNLEHSWADLHGGRNHAYVKAIGRGVVSGIAGALAPMASGFINQHFGEQENKAHQRYNENMSRLNSEMNRRSGEHANDIRKDINRQNAEFKAGERQKEADYRQAQSDYKKSERQKEADYRQAQKKYAKEKADYDFRQNVNMNVNKNRKKAKNNYRYYDMDEMFGFKKKEPSEEDKKYVNHLFFGGK